MTMEIVRIRDALLGSNVLIAKAKVKPGINILADILPEDGGAFAIRKTDPFFLLPAQAAWGDACLRFSEVLPRVAPFAPDQPALAECGLCVCMGEFRRKDIFGIIRTQHKPDWSAFLQYMAAQRARGTVPSARELKTTLAKLNEDLFSMMLPHISHLKFPHHDLGMIRDEAQLYKFVETLKRPAALTDAFVDALSNGDPFMYSLTQLNMLRNIGRTVHEQFGLMYRKRGDAAFEAATAGSDPTAFVFAEQEWLSPSLSGGFHATVAMNSLVKPQLQLKR